MPYDIDIVELEEKLRVSPHTSTPPHTSTHHTHVQRLSSDALRKFCHQLVELMENATGMLPEDDPVRYINNELKALHTTITQYAGT